jgi:hypothetical protein
MSDIPFAISRGLEENLPETLTDGKLYFCRDTKNFYIDFLNPDNELERFQIGTNILVDGNFFNINSTTTTLTSPLIINNNTIEINKHSLLLKENSIMSIWAPIGSSPSFSIGLTTQGSTID